MLKIMEQVIGAICYFAEKDKVIDGITVSETAYPDHTPPENWTENNLGCVVEFKPETETSDDPVTCFTPGKGYVKHSRPKVTADYLTFTTRAMSEIVARIMFGATEELVDGTPFIPFGNLTDRCVEGWLRVQAQDKEFANHCIMLCYVKLRLAEIPLWSEKQILPKFKCEVIASSPNTAVTDKITA